jgi:hypothetical protein
MSLCDIITNWRVRKVVEHVVDKHVEQYRSVLDRDYGLQWRHRTSTYYADMDGDGEIDVIYVRQTGVALTLENDSLRPERYLREQKFYKKGTPQFEHKMYKRYLRQQGLPSVR